MDFRHKIPIDYTILVNKGKKEEGCLVFPTLEATFLVLHPTTSESPLMS
jgi:hypothetical protein